MKLIDLQAIYLKEMKKPASKKKELKKIASMDKRIRLKTQLRDGNTQKKHQLRAFNAVKAVN